MIGYDEKRKTYFVQYKWKDESTGKWHTTMKRGFRLKREAAAYEADIKLNGSDQTGSITFRQMEERYEASNQITKEQSAKRMRYFTIRCNSFLDKPISKISKQMLEQWRTDLLADDKYATRTKNETISFVKSVFRYASELYGIPNNAAFLKSGKMTDEEIMHEEKEVWTVEQFEQFLRCVDLPIYRLFFEFLYWTGCRRGEALALQKDDVQGNTVFIHASTKHFKNGLKPTKTRTNRRIVMDDTLCRHITPLLSEPGNFLFGGERSLSITTVQRKFDQAKKKAGLNDGVTIHCLRHSHATWLINHGVNIVAVSKRLGHADIETTLKTYAHLLTESDMLMMDIINKNHK